MAKSEVATFGLIGVGWRAEFFLRVSQALPESFSICGAVVRSAEKGERFTKTWNLPAYLSLDKLLAAERPLFMVVSVPWGASVAALSACAERGVPALGETPPGPDIAGLEALHQVVRGGGRIQVAEQYAFQPLHAARLAVAHSGRIGTPSQAQVSAAHGYHGISLIRRYLGAMFENAAIDATKLVTPIVNSPGRNGAPAEEKIVDSGQSIARIRFEDGRFGLFDFSDDQYFSYIRGPRVLVRGERGEIEQETVRRLLDYRSGIAMNLVRVDTGQGGNLEGYHHRGYTLGAEWVYRNPFAPARLADDEIAIATALDKMAAYARGGPDFYSVAEASQDHYLSLLMDESVRTGRPISSSTQAWAS